MSKKKITIEELAAMIQRGFVTNEKFDTEIKTLKRHLDDRFDEVLMEV